MYNFAGPLSPLQQLAYRLTYDVIPATAAARRDRKPLAFGPTSAARVLAHAKLTFDRCGPDARGNHLRIEPPKWNDGTEAISRMAWEDALDMLVKLYTVHYVCPECDSVRDGIGKPCVSCGFNDSQPKPVSKAWGEAIQHAREQVQEPIELAPNSACAACQDVWCIDPSACDECPMLKRFNEATGRCDQCGAPCGPRSRWCGACQADV